MELPIYVFFLYRSACFKAFKLWKSFALIIQFSQKCSQPGINFGSITGIIIPIYPNQQEFNYIFIPRTQILNSIYMYKITKIG